MAGSYLYYSEPWEELLTEAVLPLIKQVMEAGLAEQYFFIRYWKRGPHIRLRFKGDPALLEQQVKPLIESGVNAFYKAKPSESEEPQALAPTYAWSPTTAYNT